MMKYILSVLLVVFIWGGVAEAQAPTGYYTRTDCSNLSTPVTNGVVCLQTTTTGGRTAGYEYYWTGAEWALQPAAAIENTPAGNIAATTVQAAINELDTETPKLAGTNFFTSDNTFEDGDGFVIGNAAEGTKRFRFDASGISGGATRTYTAPDANGEISILGQTISGSEMVANTVTATQIDETDDYAFSGTVFPEVVFASLPASGNAGVFTWVTDCESLTSCDSGGGSTRILHHDDGTGWIPIFSSASTPDLAAVMGAGNTYYGAISPATGMIVGKDSNHYGVWYYDETQGLKFQCVELGVVGDCNKDIFLNSGYSRNIYDSAGQSVWRLTESTGRVTFPTASKQPLKTVYIDAGAFSTDGTQCATPAEAALNTNKPKTWYIICTDNDAGRMTAKVTMPASWNGGTIRVRPSWFSQDSVATNIVQSWSGQCVRDGDAVADVATTGEQNATLTFESEAAETQKAFTAAITLQGTCAGGATIFLTGDIDATGTTYATMANARFLGAQIEYGISGESD